MSGGIPKRWSTVPIEEIIEDFRPGFASGEKNVKGGVAHLRMNNIGLSGELVLDLVRTVPENLAKPHHDLRWGDVLVCTTNSGELVGKVAFFGLTGRYVFSNHLTRLRPKPDLVDGKFLRWNLWLHWKTGTFDDKCKHWVNQCALPKDALLETEIVLPPLPEQRRIVAKLEKLLAKVNACQKRLAKIPVLLKRFRQSVLAAACSGRLTEDWREQHPDSEEWKSLELLEVVERIQIGPFGTQLHKADYISNGIPLINPTHIQGFRIVHDPKLSVSKAKYKELENYVLQEDDVILGRRGEMGRCALVSRNESGWLCGTGSLFVRPKSCVHPEFLFLILRNGDTKAFLESESKGTTMNNLNLQILERVPVPIPPLGEQREIVRRVESLFALADQIETRCAQVTAHAEKLTQAILAKAFRGELVSTEADFVPATNKTAQVETDRD